MSEIHTIHHRTFSPVAVVTALSLLAAAGPQSSSRAAGAGANGGRRR
jgi:hypothetical protein